METIPKVEHLSNSREASVSKPKIPPRYPIALRLLRLGFAFLGRVLPRRAALISFRLFSTPRKRARHKVSDSILEQAEIFEFLYGDQLLKGYRWGSGKQIALLVHGWESRGTALRSFVPGLLAQGFQVVAFDAPAHGNSGGRQTNLPHFSGAVKAIIHRLGGVHSIIAHSFGGASTVFALAKLDNSIEVERLVLVAAPFNLSKMLRDFLKAVNAPKAMVKKFWELVAGKLDIPIEEVEIGRFAHQVRVDRLLVVHDKQDQVIPFSDGQAIVRDWDNSQLLSTDGWGHYQLVKNEQVISRVVAFIKN